MAKFPFRMPDGPARLCRRFLGPNGDLMVVSMLVSAVLLAAVHTKVVTTRHERTFPVPVFVKSPNDSVAVASFEPVTVQLTLRGSQDEISSVDPARLAVELFPNAKKVEKWEEAAEIRSQTVKIRSQNVTGTGKLKIVSVEPSRIDVRYDAMVKWSMTGRIATPKLEGVPVQGSASVEMPTNVTVIVHGSESKIEAFRVKKILLPTSPINVVTVHVDVQTIAAAGVEEDNAPLARVAPQSALSALLSGEAPPSAGTNSAPASAGEDPSAEGGGAAEEPAPEEEEADEESGAQEEIELPAPVEMPVPAEPGE